jgi:hypothetical protein
MPKSLFQNLKLLVLSSPELDDELLSLVEALLIEHRAQYDIKSIHDIITEEEFITAEYTHIISNTVYFKLFQFTQENLIPVVMADFLFKTVEKGSQPGIRPFSPDPNNVLKKIHICVGGLPDSDKEAIYGGVRALGGSYSETLNKFVTHLISMDPDEDCCIAVNSIQDFDIKIVLPHWIDDCLKTRRKLDETPYLLKQNVPAEEQIAKVKELDVVGKDYNQVQPLNRFLGGKVFYIGSDLGLSSRYTNLIKSLIVNSGGEISEDIEDAKYYVGKYREGDEYVTASKKGYFVGNIHWILWMVEYQRWISPFAKLLHYPFVRGGLPEMKDFIISSTNYSGDARYYIMKLVEALGAKFTPSLTQENTHLIAATSKGKKYTYSLRWNLKVVNHLWLEETYQKWRVQPPNHPRYSHYPRSSTLEDIIGELPLDLDVLKKFYEVGHNDVTTNIVEDSEGDNGSDLLPTQIEQEEEEQEEENHGVDSGAVTSITETLVSNQQRVLPSPEKLDIETPVVDQSTRTPSHEEELAKSKNSTTVGSKSTKKADGAAKGVETPSKPLDSIANNPLRIGSGRKAKDKAAAKLHEDMEQLNYFQKQHRSKDIPLLPHEIEDRKRSRESERLEKESKRAKSEEAEKATDGDVEVGEQEAVEVSKPKKKKTKSNQPALKTTPYNINAIVTGWEIGFARSELAILSNLGIHLHKEFKGDTINAIISPKFMRTEKFLIGLSYRLEHIISPVFLKDVLETFKTNPSELSQLPEVPLYSLDKTNRKSVKELTDLPLITLTRRCQEKIDANQKLFEGVTFNITAKVPGGVPTITKILKSHGADAIHVLKALKDLKDIKSLKKSKREDVGVIFLGSEKGFVEKTKSLLTEAKQPGLIVEWDWVIQSIFHMELEHGKKNIVFRV